MGIVANQPAVLAGCLDIDASVKVTACADCHAIVLQRSTPALSDGSAMHAARPAHQLVSG